MDPDPLDLLVERAVAARGIADPGVLRAIRAVSRERFVPSAERARAWDDLPLPIGFGQNVSPPYVVAWTAELARVGPGDRVLEVGTGSGYQAAVLAELGAEVWSVERVPELLDRARGALDDAGYGRVNLRLGDGRRGWPEHAPYDVILVSAAAPQVPTELVDQLAPGGRLVVPVGREDQELVLLERTAWGSIRRTTHGAVAFLPLV